MTPMPRYYAKRESPVVYSNILEAVKQIMIHKHSLRTVGGAYDIPKTNLSRYVNYLKEQNVDVGKVTDDELLEHIKYSSTPGQKPVSCYILT